MRTESPARKEAHGGFEGGRSQGGDLGDDTRGTTDGEVETQVSLETRGLVGWDKASVTEDQGGRRSPTEPEGWRNEMKPEE